MSAISIAALMLPVHVSHRHARNIRSECIRYVSSVLSGLQLAEAEKSSQLLTDAIRNLTNYLPELHRLAWGSSPITAIYNSPGFCASLNQMHDVVAAGIYLQTLRHLTQFLPDVQFGTDTNTNVAQLGYLVHRQQRLGQALRTLKNRHSLLLQDFGWACLYLADLSEHEVVPPDRRHQEAFSELKAFLRNRPPRLRQTSDCEHTENHSYTARQVAGTNATVYSSVDEGACEDNTFENTDGFSILELEPLEPSHEHDIYKALIKARARANHAARANLYPVADTRRLTDSSLQALEELLPRLPQPRAAALLLTLYAGHRDPASKIRLATRHGEVALEILCNAPKQRGSHRQWLPVPYLKHHLPYLAGVDVSTLNYALGDILKHHDVVRRVGKVSIKQVTSALPIALYDIMADDILSSLLFSNMTSISQTKLHYVEVIGRHLQQAYGTALSELYRYQPSHELVLPTPSFKFLGSHKHPATDAIREWFLLPCTNRAERNRRQILRECEVLLHRATTSPWHQRLSFASGEVAVLNDKNRGGQMQMMRAVPLTDHDLAILRETDELLAAARTDVELFCVTDPASRHLSLAANENYRPSQLKKDAPKFPSEMNFARKLWRTKALHEGHYGPLADAAMGWGAHGLMPFSQYSTTSLDQFLLYWRGLK